MNLKDIKIDLSKTKRKKRRIYPESLIVILIAVCILFINTFTTRKLSEYNEAKNSAIFIRDDIEFTNDKELSEEISSYMKGSYKMIEVYDEDINLLFQVQFSDPEGGYVGSGDIKQYDTFMNVINDKEEGQTKLYINNIEEDVYFKWVTNSRQERRLLIVYNTVKEVKGLWVFSLACYLVLILAFVLLIMLQTRSYNDKIEQYHYISTTLRKELK